MSTTTKDTDTMVRDTRVDALMAPFSRLAAREKRLESDRRAALTQILSDLDWMDVPVRHAIATGRPFGTGALVHVNETHYKEDGVRPCADAHLAELCNGRWCRKVGELRWTRGKNAVGWKHLGTYRAITTDERGLWICVPEG